MTFDKLRKLAARMQSDERGYVMVFFSLVLVPVLGITALVVDITRHQTMHTQLQSIVDAAALAGAQKLDGTEDAIDQATTAVTSYLGTDPAFSEGTVDLSTVEILFFSGDGCTTFVPNTSPALAECVQVTSEIHTLGVIFAQVIGFADDLRANASATAESRGVACAVQPLMWCSPWGSDWDLDPGQMVMLKQQNGGGSDPMPNGAFGLMDPPGLTTSGGPIQAIHLAQEDPPQCYTNEQSVRSGGTGGKVEEGIGVRFGLYPASQNNELLTVPQAPNVIKGMPLKTSGKPDACKASDFVDAPGARMPRDNCFGPYGTNEAHTCDNVGETNYIGSGDWDDDAEAYWNFHHPEPMPSGLGTSGGITRYELYLRELSCISKDECFIDGSDYAFTGDESAAPLCEARPIGGPERRVIYASIVDCENSAQVVGSGGTKVTIRRARLASFFLTEPATTGGEIWAEFIDIATTSSEADGKLRNIVQLVRDFRLPSI